MDGLRQRAASPREKTQKYQTLRWVRYRLTQPTQLTMLNHYSTAKLAQSVLTDLLPVALN